MRKLLLVGVVALLSGHASAWDIRDNPDRFISVGVRTSMEGFAGSSNNLLNPNLSNETVERQFKHGNVTGYGADIRIPLVKYATFTFSYDKFRIDSETIRGANEWQNHDSLSGDRIELGMRIYLAR